VLGEGLLKSRRRTRFSKRRGREFFGEHLAEPFPHDGMVINEEDVQD
jgi:hypothetical protein